MKLLAITGDLHVNSTVALCPPTVELDDGGTYHHSKAQAWLWKKWLDYWEEAATVAKRHECEVIAILNGELADDNYHKTSQLISQNDEDQARASLKVLAPARKVWDRVIVTRGSEAHSGMNATKDEAVARAIGADTGADGLSSHFHYRGVWEGVRFDVSHHPGHGHGRVWTRGGGANRLAAEVVYTYASHGMQPPDFTIRGHNHKPEDSADNFPTRAIILPSWQLSTSFGYRIGQGASPLPVGGMLMLVEDGQVVWERKVFHRWPIKRWEEFS